LRPQRSGSGKCPQRRYKLGQVNASYDHPKDALLDQALNIDLVSQREGPSGRVAVQLSLEYARRLVEAILTTLSREKLKGWANCRWGTPMEIQSIGRLSDIVGGSLPFDFLGSSLTKVIA